jgi:hypothetical protein
MKKVQKGLSVLSETKMGEEQNSGRVKKKRGAYDVGGRTSMLVKMGLPCLPLQTRVARARRA